MARQCAGEGKSKNDCQESTIRFYPPEAWGLDYQFNIYNKMYIKDILEMKEYPVYPEAFEYKSHPIYKVDIIGVIIRVNENSKGFIYAVDDGTGVIPCCCWKSSFKQSDDLDSGKELSHLQPSLLDKVSEIDTDYENSFQGYLLGQTLHAKGKIKMFRDSKEIVAFYHNTLSDPMFEVMRMCELPRIYAQCHDKPFHLPYKIQEALIGIQKRRESEFSAEGKILYQLKSAIVKHMEKNSELVEIAVASLLKQKCVQDVFSANQEKDLDAEDRLGFVLRALNLIEEDGHVTKRADRRMFYESLLHKSKLEEHILNILNMECKKDKYSEKGCHYMHIMDELHKTFQYGKIKKYSLLHCLRKLEEQSDILRTTNTHYVLCDT